MNNKKKVVVVGLGEVGKPLLDIISAHHETIGVDIDPVGSIENVDVLHICYPFQIKDFVGETARYIDVFRPSLSIIDSTVAVGTTRAVADRTGAVVVNSPVRGKHARMLEDVKMYTKFVGGTTLSGSAAAAKHFESVGLQVKVLPSPEATELAKLTETTYFGLMIAFAQEVERLCDQYGASYDQVISFYSEIKFFPPVTYFPGVIGGHCVMPNIELLGIGGSSVLLDAIKASNELKIARDAHRTIATPVS